MKTQNLFSPAGRVLFALVVFLVLESIYHVPLDIFVLPFLTGSGYVFVMIHLKLVRTFKRSVQENTPAFGVIVFDALLQYGCLAIGFRILDWAQNTDGMPDIKGAILVPILGLGINSLFSYIAIYCRYTIPVQQTSVHSLQPELQEDMLVAA